MGRILLGFLHSSSTTYSAKSSLRHVLFIFPSAGCHYYCVLGPNSRCSRADYAVTAVSGAPSIHRRISKAKAASPPPLPSTPLSHRYAYTARSVRTYAHPRNEFMDRSSLNGAGAGAQAADEARTNERLPGVDLGTPSTLSIFRFHTSISPHFRCHAATASALHRRARPLRLKFVEGLRRPNPHHCIFHRVPSPPIR
ncbi:hypothetical protein B0H16DRAFT_1858759 [Mycena metata]|uniref:Uncharacterized protein n=1 Tax=Mycena metata TaxID=1033252 RepID=A0AAD7K115_9AGAR|nr:hypothetical protein B0H16DRAFT_1858759 [Mycena metata]